MNTTPLELRREDLFASPIYRGSDKSFLHLDKDCDKIIDKISICKPTFKQKLVFSLF